MTPEQKSADKLGPGGYKCPCYGPSPKDRQKHRRLVRRRMAQEARKEIKRQLEEET